MHVQMVHKYFNNVCMVKTMAHDDMVDIHILRDKDPYVIKHVTYKTIVEEICESKERTEESR